MRNYFESLRQYPPHWTVGRPLEYVGERFGSKAELLEKIFGQAMGYPYEVGKDNFLAVWDDLPMGYRCAKIKSLDAFTDRCMVENKYHPENYAIFDAQIVNSFTWDNTNTRQPICRVLVTNIFEYNISEEEEFLFDLSLS